MSRGAVAARPAETAPVAEPVPFHVLEREARNAVTLGHHHRPGAHRVLAMAAAHDAVDRMLARRRLDRAAVAQLMEEITGDGD